jgi:putative transposase
MIVLSTMILTYKYKIKNKSAKRALNAHAISINQVWNSCNGHQKYLEKRYRDGFHKSGNWKSWYDFKSELNGVGKELNIPQQTIGLVCKEFTTRRDKRKRSLKYRVSFGKGRSLGWIPFSQQDRKIVNDANTDINNHCMYFMGKRYTWFGNKRRQLPLDPVDIKGGCFTEDACGNWWVCFIVDVPLLPLAVNHVDNNKTSVGIDLGLKSLCVTDDGVDYISGHFYRKYEAQLKIAQRANNKKLVRAIHQKIKNCRHNYLHQVSHELTSRYQHIVVGNVSSSSQTQTNRAKSVYDVAWFAFKSYLEYKARRHQGIYEEVNESFTTVTCSSCHARSGPRGLQGLRMREWVCISCGKNHKRDVNAAINIHSRAKCFASALAEGLTPNNG